MGDKHSLINLNLGEPMSKLAEALRATVGTLYEPTAIRRRAAAQADAAIIQAEAQEKIAAVEYRAKARIEHLEHIRQQNLDRIAAEAALSLPDQVSKEPVSTDWMMQFVNAAQDVSDEEMQQIWAKILAGEVASPGTYHKRTVEFLKTLEKWEAEALTRLGSFAFGDPNGWPALLAVDETSRTLQAKYDSDLITHFVSIGILLALNVGNRNQFLGTTWSYFGRAITLQGQPKGPKVLDFKIGTYAFTVVGKQLLTISGAQEDVAFLKRAQSDFRGAKYTQIEMIISECAAD